MTPNQQNGGRLLAIGIAALAVAGGGCTRVVEVVQPEDCAARPSDPDCAPTPWPTTGHSANSDPWIVSHHDVITQMSPHVMVLNFANGVSLAAAQATAQRQVNGIAQGSQYHGYSDSKAPVFLNYQIVEVVDLTDHVVPAGWTNPSSTQLPVTPSGTFDLLGLFSARYSAAYGFRDPLVPSRNLSLCELFEQGVINEVWIEDGETGSRRVPLNLERKQVYDATNHAVPDVFNACVGGDSCAQAQNLICGVTVRMAHLDPNRGPGCDLDVRGWGIEGMGSALPAYAPTLERFLNGDFQTRFGVQFDGWQNLCDSTSPPPCVTYPNATTATGTYANGTSWTISPFISACGNTTFPPNAREPWDYDNTSGVQSNCEHFGLGDGVNGADAVEPYTSAKIATLDMAYPDCGGGWQIYWRQNIPGLNNHAKTADGAPMRNWWPLLFY